MGGTTLSISLCHSRAGHWAGFMCTNHMSVSTMAGTSTIISTTRNLLLRTSSSDLGGRGSVTLMGWCGLPDLWAYCNRARSSSDSCAVGLRGYLVRSIWSGGNMRNCALCSWGTFLVLPFMNDMSNSLLYLLRVC